MCFSPRSSSACSGLLFGQPERSFQSAELIRLARGGGTGAGSTGIRLSRLLSRAS